MIKGSLEKLALLCAAAGISASEWDDFVSEVRQLGYNDTKRLYNRIRQGVRAIERDSLDQDAAFTGSNEAISSNVIRDVMRLIDSAELSAVSAAHILTNQIKKYDPRFNEDRLKFNSKDGLRRWLIKIVREYGESALLSLAANAFRSNRGVTDWKLT